MKKLYLTIDDSPSPYTDQLVDYLVNKNIPAILFVRGDMMARLGTASITRAIENGFLVGNHSYAHDRASDIGFDEQVRQFEATQAMIARAYRDAGVSNYARYVRFPHLDRGTTSVWPIDFDSVPNANRDKVKSMFGIGVRAEKFDPPTAAQRELKQRLQAWFAQNQYQKLPTPELTFPWWHQSELGGAIDSLITFSSCDWMLNPRHVGKWRYQTPDDLKRHIDHDEILNDESSANVILMHDDRENLLTITENMIEHMLNSNFTFLQFKEN
ncbi:MAG: polysaccharide deacetylase family protein [Alphaproteobacteria bacterium]|nr:polysaccharide deacetylase family protein [Alphaproteobacteria bacterium]